MLVPGISGGTMAVVLHLYDRLVFSVSNIFKDKKNIIFLMVFSFSALVGMFIVSKPILYLLETYPAVARFFFIGIVIGSIPSLYKESEVTRFNYKYLLLIILGIGIIVLFNFLPEGIFTSQSSYKGLILQFIGGIISCLGFLLPGISFSYLLLIIGLYESVLGAISTLNIVSLIPFGLGFIIGFILLIKILEMLLTKYKKITYMLILGFLIGSIHQIIPSTFHKSDLILSLITFICGFLLMNFVSKIENNKNEEIDNVREKSN